MPWKVPEDWKMFKRLTKGEGNNAVVMGRKTSESLPNGLYLPGRHNIILSKQNKANGDEWEFVKGIENIDTSKYEEVWIIGGAQVYTQFLESGKVEEIHVSIIPEDYNCDQFFPMDLLHRCGFQLDIIENMDTFAHLIYTRRFI
jgi:dihydrofolate reductase